MSFDMMGDDVTDNQVLVDRGLLTELVRFRDDTMRILTRVLDDSTEDGRTRISRIISKGQTVLVIDAIDRILDENDRARAGAA